MGVYENVSRAEAEKDETGKFVKVKWVRTKKGDGVRCRLVAQVLHCGERLDELFAGTPSLGSVRVALTHAMMKDTHKVMVMRNPTFGVFRVAAHGSPVWGWYAGGETKVGHFRNTRCATDLGRGRSVNLGSSRIQPECLPARCLLQLGEGRYRSRARR